MTRRIHIHVKSSLLIVWFPLPLSQPTFSPCFSLVYFCFPICCEKATEKLSDGFQADNDKWFGFDCRRDRVRSWKLSEIPSHSSSLESICVAWFFCLTFRLARCKFACKSAIGHGRFTVHSLEKSNLCKWRIVKSNYGMCNLHSIKNTSATWLHGVSLLVWLWIISKCFHMLQFAVSDILTFIIRLTQIRYFDSCLLSRHT